jgi:hypothetical protein
MQIFIPKKNDYILLTHNINPSMGTQKLEFLSKKHPSFHSHLTSFILKENEWYQIGSIYTLRSDIFLTLRMQRTKKIRSWMRKRIEEESNKISVIYGDDEEAFILKNRSIECLATDLNKKSLLFHTLEETLKTQSLLELDEQENYRRWEQLEID